MSALWRFPLGVIWNALSEYTTLGSVADVHRGIEYRLPLRAHWDELVSAAPRREFAHGLVNVEYDFEPFRTRARHYVNMDPRVMRGGAYRLPWDEPKVLANAHRLTRGPWPLFAVPDRRGLVLYQNFHGIWPTGEWPVEVLAAVLNGHVANAFIDLREEKRHNRVKTIRAVPIPRLSREGLASIANLVREYEQQREFLESEPSEEADRRCRELLAEIDTTILRAYALPPDVQAELGRHFARAPRPGPPSPRSKVSVQVPLRSEAENGPWVDRLEVIDPPGVNRLLREEPELAALVAEAADQIGKFIPGAHMSLELLADPDYGDEEQLFLGVSTILQDGEALEALRRFDQEWWVHHVRRARGLLCVDLSDE